MLYLITPVSGSEIAQKLAANPEELADALVEWTDYDAPTLGPQVSEHIPFGMGKEIAAFLRAIADAVEDE
jgi:hypothetical protein